jgi:hypothetical protein
MRSLGGRKVLAVGECMREAYLEPCAGLWCGLQSIGEAAVEVVAGSGAVGRAVTFTAGLFR